ncbi:MAG: TetR/AcrR family transcriptional regulator [Faecalibacterium prausnitzii]
MGFLDIRIEKTERAIKQAFMELRREKPVEKIRVKELCDRACINKSTFYAHYQDIYALANAMEDEMVHAVVESLPRLTASDVSERTEWLAREMFRAFTAHQAEISVLFSGSRQGLFINRVEQAMCQCIAQTDPTFEIGRSAQGGAFLLRRGASYTFTTYCGQMDEKRLVTLLASIARAAQRIRM